MASGGDAARVGPSAPTPGDLELDLFIGSDPLRKGAALDAVQIAEIFVKG